MQCLVDSREVHVHRVCAPPADGRLAVLLLHGACQDHRAWTPVMEGLARAGHEAYAPDLPGHSASAGPPCVGVAELAAWLLDLLDALGLARCALAGHSMGSLVALHAAALAPQRISHVALVGTAVPMPVAPALLERARSDPDSAMRDMALWSHKGSRAQPPDAAAVEATLALMRSVQGRWPAGDLLATDLGACNAYAQGLEMARRLRMPVQLVLGESDRMTPVRATQALREAVPQAGLSLLDAGHALMQERPRELLQALLGLLGRECARDGEGG